LEKRALLKEVKKKIENYRSFNAKMHALKSIKRKELLRIGLKDIYSKKELVEITEELSVLASTLITELLDLCYKETLAKNKIIKTTRRYCIVSLGKLGGNELNYSSDADLIIFYDKENRNYSSFFTERCLSRGRTFIQN